MDENKLKTIVEEVVNKAIDPIKKDLNGIKKNLTGVNGDLAEVKGNLAGIEEDLAGIKETQKNHTRKLEALAGDTEQLLLDVKGIRDTEGMYHSRNKREIDEIKKYIGLPLMSDIPE